MPGLVVQDARVDVLVKEVRAVNMKPEATTGCVLSVDDVDAREIWWRMSEKGVCSLDEVAGLREVGYVPGRGISSC